MHIEEEEDEDWDAEDWEDQLKRIDKKPCQRRKERKKRKGKARNKLKQNLADPLFFYNYSLFFSQIFFPLLERQLPKNNPIFITLERLDYRTILIFKRSNE